MLPSRDDRRWVDLIEHPERHSYDFLALRIMMQRFSRRPVDERRAALDELYRFFQKNEKLMTVDVARLFG